MGVNLLIVFGDLEAVVDLYLLFRFRFACVVGLLVAAVVCAFDVWSFGLVNFLEHTASLLRFLQFLFIPYHSLTVTNLVALFLHFFELMLNFYKKTIYIVCKYKVIHRFLVFLIK